MKQSKLIALFLIVTVFLTVMVPCVGAQTVPVFSVQSVSAYAGDTVEVNINVKDNPGILGAKLKITYDSPLSLIDATAGEAFAPLSMTEPGAYTSPCNFMWDGQSISESQIKDGTILKLKFSIPENTVSGTYNVKVSFAQGEIIDNDLLPVSATVVNGYVDVVDYVPGDLNSDGNVDITDVIMYRRDMVGGYQQTVNTKAMDVNGDGIGGIADLILIRRYLVGGYDVELKPSAPATPSTPSTPSTPPLMDDSRFFPGNIIDINDTKRTISIIDEDTGVITTYKYTSTTTVTYWNGTEFFDDVLYDAFLLYGEYVIGGFVEMEFDEDGNIEHFTVNSYYTDRVAEVRSSKIYLQARPTINLNEEEVYGVEYTITLNGEEIGISDIQKGDIITYRSANNKKFFEIIVTRNTVEGAIESISKNSDGRIVYTIGGKRYKASQCGVMAGFDNRLPSTPGAEGVFYLDAFGEIAYYSRAKSAAERNFAYVLAVGADSTAFGAALRVKMMDAEGNIGIYTVADKFYVYDIVYEDEDFVEIARNNGEAYDVYDGANINEDVEYIFYGLENTLIAYTVSSTGELTKITLPAAGDADVNDDEEFNFFGAYTDKVYDADNAKLGDVYVNEETLIFAVGAYDEEDYRIVDYTVLEDEGWYTFDAYVVNSTKTAKILVLRSSLVSSNAKGNIALYTGYATAKNEDGKTVSAISFIKSGEVKTVFCESKSATFELPKASVFEYELNDKGEIKAVTKIFGATTNMDAIAGMYGKVTSDAPTYVVGQVKDKTNRLLKLGDFESNDFEYHEISENANIYLVERIGSYLSIKTTDVDAIGINRFDTSGALVPKDDADNYMVVIKYINKKATDVVVYKNMFMY